MDIARTYGNIVRKQIYRNPKKALSLIGRGLFLEGIHKGYLPDKRMTKGYSRLNKEALFRVARALKDPEHLVWANIFAPVEILMTFGLSAVSTECISSYLSGFYLEDEFIDLAEGAGISGTLCSYHRNFIGALEAGILPKPKASVTTSMVCDGNINTFRYLQRKLSMPLFTIDVPENETPEAVAYLKQQLEELITALSGITGVRFDIDRLRETIKEENAAKRLYLEFLEKRIEREYPNTLTLVIFLLYATHLEIGAPWVTQLFRDMNEEIMTEPYDKKKRLFWVHVTPYAQPSLAEYLNYGEKIAIAADDFNLDYIEEMDERNPLEAIARKMIRNIYNGPFSKKADRVAEYAKRFRCDGVVEFCHWGCRQSAGGVMLLKDRLKEDNMPFLALDGDAIDRRNTPDGQIRTRFEAFLEEIGQS